HQEDGAQREQHHLGAEGSWQPLSDHGSAQGENLYPTPHTVCIQRGCLVSSSMARRRRNMAISMARSLRSPSSSSRASANRRSRDSGLPELLMSASSRLTSPPVSLMGSWSFINWRVAGSKTKGPND